MDDLVAFHLYNSEHSASFRRGRLLLQLVVGLMTAASSTIYFVAGDYLKAVVWLVAGLLLVAVVPRSFRWSVERQALKVYRRSQKKGLVGVHRLSLAPEAMVHTSEREESRVVWSGVERVVSSDEYVFIYTSAATATVVPKRAFSDDAECAEFIETARQYLAPTVA